MSLDPTPEQSLILAEARGTESLLINALAGAAKTTTLVMLAHKLPLVPTLSCAFNKRIADEMAKRMPSHIQCATLNSLGHRVWGQKLGKRLVVESDKVYNITSELMAKSPGEERKEFGEAFSSLLRAVRMAKSMGYIPAGFTSAGEPLTSQIDLIETFAPQIDVDPSDWFIEKLDQILGLSIAEAFEGKIDFDDQIYMSTLFGGVYPRFPIIMVDEAQDLSPLNHRTLQLMFGGRIIAVGDPFQSIYAFRGAEHGSMEHLREEFSMKELSLSISFRCPIEVVKRAQVLRVPAMRYPDWAVEGHVEILEEWDQSHIPDGAAIICRNNAPLFSLALRLIRQGRGIKLLGGDIGGALVKVLTKLGPGRMPQQEVIEAIGKWKKEQLAKAHKARKASIEDRAACLLVFADVGKTLDEAIAYAKHLFASAGPIQLMTGHKSKGMEYDVVYHLNPYLIPSKWALEAASAGEPGQLDQERNLAYVILTRSKDQYYEMTLENMQ